MRALPSSSLSSTDGSRGRFVACPRVSRLKLRASTVTARAVNPLFVMENSPRHFLPHSTMIGDTVWAETTSPRNENCRSSRDKSLFILRVLSAQKRSASTSSTTHLAASYELSGLSADGDGPRVTRYRKVRSTNQRKQDAV